MNKNEKMPAPVSESEQSSRDRYTDVHGYYALARLVAIPLAIAVTAIILVLIF